MTVPASPAPAAASRSAETLPRSIQLLRRLNPLIGRLLQSPLHGLLSHRVLLLEMRGRVSGRKLSLPLSWVASGDDVILCSRTSKWWRNAVAAPSVEVTLRGKRRRMRAERLYPASPEALDGLRRFLTKDPGTGELLYEVRRDEQGRPREDDLRREVHGSIVVRLTPIPNGGA